MAGIYLHIPFCRQACYYCNFHFSVLPEGKTNSLPRKNEMIAALLKEIELQRNYLEKEHIETIYMGGGTPSLLSAEDLEQLIYKIREVFIVTQDAEITIECNPDDITNEKLQAWKSIGINRLSMGVQSFFEEDLRWMNRIHSARQAAESLNMATAHFSNITIDLIYGSPGLTHEKWLQNVKKAVEYNIPHLSCYALTVEPQTALQKRINTGKAKDINPAAQSEQFLLLIQWLEEAGYEHYEISNFAKPGFRSRHNSSYWQGKKYLGIGPSAHSFDGKVRQWNISNNSLYISSIKQGNIPAEKEILSVNQQINEYLMTSLRTIEGINMTFLEKKFGATIALTIRKEAAKHIHSHKLVETTTGMLQLTKEGKLFADGIASDLFIL